MTIEFRWKILSECLYAYLTRRGDEILYIGKAWSTTVRVRWSRSNKEKFWEALEKQRGIKHHIALIGKIYLPEGHRLTRELLYDIESLLINKEKPWGNRQSRNNRIRRPGMQVDRIGRRWPGSRRYRDK